jgi:molybdopterin-guanine dinucleotide biosynthesis protein A
MGRPKAWLPWGGRPILQHVVERLAEAVDEVWVVAAPDQHLPDVAAPVVADRDPGLGPLAGIREGLAHARGELAFVTATDAPYLTPAFVRHVLAAGGAAAPRLDGFVHPLSAAYPTAAAGEAEALLAAGRRRPLDLLEALDYTPLGPESLPDPDSVRGFNTPEAYLDAVRKESDAPVCLELLGRAGARAGRRVVEVEAGRLGDVLGAAGAGLSLVDAGRVARAFRVSLDGRDFVDDLALPVGPGEHVIVLDASVGG